MREYSVLVHVRFAPESSLHPIRLASVAGQPVCTESTVSNVLPHRSALYCPVLGAVKVWNTSRRPPEVGTAGPHAYGSPGAYDVSALTFEPVNGTSTVSAGSVPLHWSLAGGGHGLVVHVVPGPEKMPVHRGCVVTVHRLVEVTQHEPGPGQTLGTQAEPSPE